MKKEKNETLCLTKTAITIEFYRRKVRKTDEES